MKRLRDPKWTLIILFGAIIAAVPLVQAFSELIRDQTVAAFDLFSEAPTAENLRAYEHNLENASWASRLSRPLLQYAQFKWLNEGGEKALVGKPGWYFYKPGLRYMLGKKKDLPGAESTNDPVKAIVDFRDQLEARGVKLLLMPVPNKESIYPDYLGGRAKNLRGGVMSPRTFEVLEGLREANVEMIDLFKIFDEARQGQAAGESGGAELYLAQDTHWSPAGVAIAAKAVARRLEELGWARPGTVEYTTTNASVRRIGDILKMMQAPMIEQTITPEQVSTEQVIRSTTGVPYQDEASAEILVLGDSFMRIYQTDAPTSAGFISHLAKELKQPLISLVNDGGGATLVREELCAQPVFLKGRKVLIWEFVERDIGLGLKGWPRTPLPTAPAEEKGTSS